MLLENRTIPALLALVVLAAGADGQTITVTTSADVTDVAATATVAELPGPDGVVSFREALRASDNTPGVQTVGFGIPRDDWYLPDIFPGQVLIQGSLSWSAAEPVTLDGTTQTALTGDTYPDGNEVCIYGLSTYLNGDGSVVTGLHDTRVELNGSACEVYGNTGGMYIVLFLGSGSTVHDNEAETIKLYQSNDNVIVRNTTSRVRVDGWFDGGAPATNNRIGGPDPADRNFITGWGNYGEHGVPSGTTLELFDTLGTLVQNNWIGTTPDGMAVGNPASTTGIALHSENRDLRIEDNLIVGSAVGAGPVAGVVYGQAIWIQAYGNETGFTRDVEIVGNTLGLNAAGEPLLGGVYGIWISDYAQEYVYDLRIGGTAPGEGNVIAGHGSYGVRMEGAPGIPQPATAGIRISGNSFHSNGDIAIELMPDTWTFGPTPNDPLDADAGANGLQNWPVVTSATLQGSALRVVGSLHSAPSLPYTVELFGSPACDPSGFGPAQVFLGVTTVFTDGAGDAPFDVTLPAAVPAGWIVTATATLEPVGRTSELSACAPITAELEPGTAVCFGDGSGAACPCGNDSTTAGRGCRTSAGEGMVVTGSGSASLSADDLELAAHDVPVGNSGIFYVGRTPLAGNVLYDGLQCAGGDVLRFRGRVAAGTSTVTDTGFVAQDPGGAYWTAGTTYTFQYFSRDVLAGASPCGGFANLSAAYAVTMTP